MKTIGGEPIITIHQLPISIYNMAFDISEKMKMLF